jgi:hypothetical protein
LAETNSTLAFFDCVFPLRPYPFPAAMMVRRMLSSWSVARRKLMKPGPAISTAETTPGGKLIPATSFSAIFRGGEPSVLASASARFEATSPWLFSRGVSSSTTTSAGAPSVAATRASSDRIVSSAVTSRLS